MTDRRTTPNPNYVDAHTPARIIAPLVDLLDQPCGTRNRQLLFGDPVTILGAIDGFSYVRSDKDGYIGFVPPETLGERTPVTHRVSVLATHAYRSADIKSGDQATFSFGCFITSLSETDEFVETNLGFVPKVHLTSHEVLEKDPVDVALRFLGTPYLWGGNSRLGMDCSGLVQVALLACGMECPGDSDQQRDAVGAELPEGSEPRSGDLFFWPGHVALAVDARTMIHATGHFMSTVLEPIEKAKARIDAAGEGPLQSHKRL
ncbi:MAG: NlpC/P60 family protein [Paracoccaceae bacterium]